MTNKRVLVLGGNFAGMTAALSVKHRLGTDVDVTVVSKSTTVHTSCVFPYLGTLRPPARGGSGR